MASYRVFTLNSDDHVTSSAHLDAEDDWEAIQLSRLRLEHCDLELWYGDRKVARVPKDDLPILMVAR